MMDIALMDVTFDRTPLKKNYTQVSNELIQEVIKKKRLSADALTLMTVLYALYPEDERLTNFNSWMEMLGWGINRIKKAISDLAGLGYIHIQKKRDQWGRFTHNSYYFYHSPSDNPYFGKTSENDVSSVVQNPCYGDEERYIFYYNTSFSCCQSVFSVSETEQKDFPTEIVETVEDSESNESLTDCIKRNIEQITAEKPELKEKVSRLEMPVFVTYLVGVLQNALQTLKHPKAKGKFIKSVILHKINEFKAKKSVPTPKPEKKTIPIVDEKKSERQAFTSWLKERMDFEGNLQENDTEYCHFLISVADALTELVFTNRAGKRVVDGYELREGLSQIDRIDGELEEFANEFFHYFKRLLEMKADSGDVVRDIKRYMTAVLPDFVKRYSAGNILPTYNGEEMGGFRYQKHSLTSEQVARVNEYLQFANRFDEMPPATYRSILLGLSDEKQKYYLSRIPKERFDKEVPAGQPLTEKTLEDFVTMAEYLIVQEQATGIPMIW